MMVDTPRKYTILWHRKLCHHSPSGLSNEIHLTRELLLFSPYFPPNDEVTLFLVQFEFHFEPIHLELIDNGRIDEKLRLRVGDFGDGKISRNFVANKILFNA